MSPKPGRLVNSVGVCWDYQAPNQLIKQLYQNVADHYNWFSKGYTGKFTIPLYLFASGAGTEKSRNSAELHNTVLKCFDGTYGYYTEQLEKTLRTPLVFHVALEISQTPQFKDNDPMEIIGYKMLHQLIEDKEDQDNLTAEWSPPHPEQILKAVEQGNASGGPRTIFLVIDGLNVIADLYGETALLKVLGELGNLANGGNGFRIICATTTASEPIDKFQKMTRRKIVTPPCSPIKPPRIRALESMSYVFQTYIEDPNSEVTTKDLEQIVHNYSGITPPDDGEAIVKAFINNRLLYEYKSDRMRNENENCCFVLSIILLIFSGGIFGNLYLTC